MRAKITKRAVDGAVAGDRDYFLWDSEVAGFGLKVTSEGARVYVLQYRFLGRQRRYTIGRHGAPWTPDGARQEAVRLLGEVAHGVDPAEVKMAARKDLTLSELCDLYLAEGCGTKKPTTVAMDRRNLDNHVKPLLGPRKVKSITKADVERLRDDIAAGKTAKVQKTGRPRGRSIVRGGKMVANRALDTLAAVFEFARGRGMRQDNPARGVKAFKERRRERFLSAAETGDLADELSAAEARGKNPSPIAALRLLLLTGCRKNEILGLKWSYVDWERSCFRLPDSKTDAKVVPVGAAVLQLLSSLPRVDGNPYVLPGAVPGDHYKGLQKVWDDIRTRCGLKGVRLHDKRHSFASVGVAGGDSLYLVGKLLGHARAATTERYAHLGDDPLKAAADRIADRIAAAMKPRDAGGEVVELPKRKA
jgi:integrase